MLTKNQKELVRDFWERGIPEDFAARILRVDIDDVLIHYDFLDTVQYEDTPEE